MLAYPQIDPVALSLGPLQIHWYGVMYLLAFAIAWQLGARNSRRSWSPIKPCLLYTSPSPRDVEESRMPSSA